MNLAFHAGTVTALTGENGSGKSTIARIVGGALAPDSGEILLDGKAVRIPDSRTALGHGIALISQEIALAGDLSVAENVFLGRQPVKRGIISWRKLEEQAAGLFDGIGMRLDPRARVADLPIESRQQVEIARALATEPRVLVLDEATSSLSEKVADMLLGIVADRRARGAAVVMITHRMNEIYRIADTAAVLRDGRIVATAPVRETHRDDLVRLMVGRELGDYYGRRRHEPDRDSVALRARGLRAASGAGDLGPVDLAVAAGEIVGVAGLSGSGKDVLGRALAGVIAAEGEVRVRDRPLPTGSPGAALRGGLGFVPEDRRAQALLGPRSVAENLALAWPDRVFRRGVLRPAAERAGVASAVTRYGIRTASMRLPVSALSGGNQQKVVIGRLFDRQLPAYVLSEPTRGVDIQSKSAIYALLRQQAERGAGVLFISSELNELCGLCDRVLVMFQGRVVASLDGSAITEEAVNHAMVTGEAPGVSAPVPGEEAAPVRRDPPLAAAP
ncbi:sugar ABC transporter ATP-binding protein [Streptomyces sp. PT12]|uniref:sugar ABC transporter ATP-binding protein n=1 Tax=Streptomyces sp. PT12 TaxID=1510197 RepID=UPI001C67DE8A|nr:sugar ABC transporter ATP-binding protein [Streptomyces sp. PT12]